MSTRVFNPMVMSDMHRMLTAFDSNPRASRNPSLSPDSSEIVRVRRNLFGPIDHEETNRIAERELAGDKARDTERWNFDFEAETQKKGTGPQRYDWQKVAATDLIPRPYALRRLPYLQAATVTAEERATTNTLRRLPHTQASTATVERRATTTVNEAASSAQNADSSTNATPNSTTKKQARITDFMRVRKRGLPASPLSSKDTETTVSSSRTKQARTTPS